MYHRPPGGTSSLTPCTTMIGENGAGSREDSGKESRNDRFDLINDVETILNIKYLPVSD